MILLLVMACSGCSNEPAPSAAPRWRQIACAEGAFTATFPGAPLRQATTRETPFGPVTVVLFVHECPALATTVAYSELPAASIALGTKEELLQRAEDGAIANVRGKLLKRNVAVVSGHDGIELLLHTKEGACIRNRLLVVNRRIYQILVAGTREQVASADAERFLDSLQLEQARETTSIGP